VDVSKWKVNGPITVRHDVFRTGLPSWSDDGLVFDPPRPPEGGDHAALDAIHEFVQTAHDGTYTVAMSGDERGVISNEIQAVAT